MKTDSLHQFLKMATMIQQFPLILVRNAKDEEALSHQLQETGLVPQYASDLQTLFDQQSGTGVVRLSKENIEEATEIVSSLRHTGLAEFRGMKKRFPDRLKLLFVMSEKDFHELSDELAERILSTFSPVYRFDHD